MSNLIITIISIALVAVVALIGIWYGGSAFSNTSVTAQANTMIAHAEQIASAMRLWSMDNGGLQTGNNVGSACKLNGSAFETALINGKYMQSTPGQAFHSGLCGNGYHNYSPGAWAVTADGSCSSTTPIKTLVATFGNVSYLQTNCDFPTFAMDASKVCDAINKTQGVATPPSIGSWTVMETTLGSHSFICEQAGGIYFFVYRVF